ncbi:MAG: RND transporter [Novosphingobium sp. 28-62-57]|uniref:efflux transporter outer membrane subunit n=1 Tax=unclassified Novosphingobium TaxID=2644732 RepID=UPI000BCD22DE|nr:MULTISPECIES: efflux transporter outer membrane subunit [unclassified Novosphingobium]OYW48991.1 MAG: RND transporter [Novosphingobium sp. 12-62-10]OYZ09542.1 MAG: RND transporter [Novosphingobium sp. 28-62-57]OZA37857.1 MAG: RND transporter [Novosphingobium sp. 17-62-9]HQS70179.1 efflux transporter outer membrane subunit [Novosphingobium sp.]
MLRSSSFRRATGATLLAALLAGCTTVGPNYAGAPDAAPQAAARGGFIRADGSANPAAPSPRWWESLGDPVLNQLVDLALADSPSIAAANARVAQSRASLAASRTAVLPTINTSFAAPYINVPGNLLGEGSGRDEINAYNLGFDASWEIDLFGGTRRKVEAATARAEAAEAGAADARVTLSAEIARAYVGLRARQAMRGLQQRQAEIDRALVELARQRFAAGTTAQQPVNAAEAQAFASEADLARSEAEIAVLIDQIAVLAGKEPGALDSLLTAPAPVPLPPAQISIGDPALLLRSRPDIRMAERQLAAANADIGARMADKFPKISFLGLLGLGGQNIGDVLDPGNIVGIALPQLKWNLFDGGRADRQVEVARGASAEAEANYRNAVLRALQDAEGSLARFGGQRIALGKALDAETRARRNVDLQQQRLDAGRIARTDRLDAERQALQLSMAAASAKAELATGFIAVEKALGLGWQAAAPDK